MVIVRISRLPHKILLTKGARLSQVFCYNIEVKDDIVAVEQVGHHRPSRCCDRRGSTLYQRGNTQGLTCQHIGSNWTGACNYTSTRLQLSSGSCRLQRGSPQGDSRMRLFRRSPQLTSEPSVSNIVLRE